MKRKQLKTKLAPKDATTFGKICSLEFDHVDSRGAWMSIQENSVFIAKQKNGEEAKSTIQLTRKEFEKFAQWYNEKQKNILIKNFHMKTKSQKEKIEQHLLKGRAITAIEALKKFGCFRLASRVNEIKEKYRVSVEMIKLRSGVRVAKYSINI